MAMFLIVGGAGYIGSHMVKHLASHGHDVVVLDDLSSGHRKSVVAGKFIQGDLGDQDLIEEIFSTSKIDCVMHFAAFSLVGESVELPLNYYHNNTAKTTSAVYGEPENLPILETEPTEPTNPYGRSKLFIEEILEDCDTAHGLKHISLRYFNAAGASKEGEIGEDHSPETHLIPLVLQVALGQREYIEIYGTDWDTPDGTCIRDYIHVMDLAEAHILAAQRLMEGGESGVYNLGCQSGYSVREIISIAREITRKPIPAVESDRRPGDPARLVASSEKIKSELGWNPRYDDPERIIATAWKWHSANPQGYSDV
jgi:UDP-glucose 4-epimerase